MLRCFMRYVKNSICWWCKRKNHGIENIGCIVWPPLTSARNVSTMPRLRWESVGPSALPFGESHCSWCCMDQPTIFIKISNICHLLACDDILTSDCRYGDPVLLFVLLFPDVCEQRTDERVYFSSGLKWIVPMKLYLNPILPSPLRAY